MNQHETLAFNQAVQLAQAGQKAVAYSQLKMLLFSNPNDTNLLLWIAFTTSDLGEASQSIDLLGRIDPNNSTLASARSWLAGELAKQPPQVPPAYMESPPPNNYYSTNPNTPPMPPYPQMPLPGQPPMYYSPPPAYGIPASPQAYPVPGYYPNLQAPPPAMNGGMVFLIFLGYLIPLWIAGTILSNIVGYSFILLISFVLAIATTIETVQRRSKYGTKSASHPVVIFLAVAVFVTLGFALYMADFHRFQSRRTAGWFSYPQPPRGY